MKKLLFAVLISTLVACTVTAPAQAKKPTLKSLAKSVAVLQKQVKTLSQKLTTATGTISSQSTTINSQSTTINSQSTTINSLTSQLKSDAATISAQGSTIAGLQSSLNTDTSAITAIQNSNVMALNPYVSVTTSTSKGTDYVVGPRVVFQKCNVQVRSSSYELDNSGLGNLIVGWDDPTNGTPPAGYRAGSNNLICGDYGDFQKHGEFVAGYENTVSADYASVTGGQINTASGACASITGGSANIAAGGYASVNGGLSNKAYGMESVVCGGNGNTVGSAANSLLAWYSTIGGGSSVSLLQYSDSYWAAGDGTQTATEKPLYLTP